MKKIKYILILIVAIGAFSACEVEDRDVDQIKSGSNLATFEQSSQTATQIAETGEHTFDVQVKLTGASLANVSGDVTVTIGADGTSTAEAGTHFRLDNTTLVLKESNNYLGLFTVTMLTTGVPSPLAKVLGLSITAVSGGGNVIASGKLNNVTLSYACPSDLSGTYSASMVYTAYDGSVSNISFTDNITETGLGEYRTSEVGHWIGGLGVGTPGYTFLDVCSSITIPGQNLVDYYGNWVLGTEAGSVDDVTGVISVKYSICYPEGSDNCRFYDVVYTPVK